MAVTQKVTLYNNKFTVPPVINAVQNDTDRLIEAYFGDFTLQVGMTGVLSFIRSDRTHYEVSATLDPATNTATAELDQALTQAGVTQAQLKITDSGNVGSTFTFMIKVQPDVAGISVPQDGWSAQEFDQRLTDAENAIDAVEEDVADLQEKEYDYAPVITDTASGSIASFPDGADGYPLKECVVNVDAIQDLHGYDHPWPAGGGKNKLVYPHRQSSYTTNGVTFTSNPDGTVTANGTATATAVYTLHSEMALADGTYILSGGISSNVYVGLGYAESDSSTADVRANAYASDSSPFTTHKGRVTYVQCIVYSGQTVNNVVFKPMIRLATESDATFAPYSNECPISGWSEAKVTRTGKNLLKDIAYQANPTIIMLGQTENYWDAQKTYLKAGTYIISFDSTVAGGGVYFGTSSVISNANIVVGKTSLVCNVVKDGYYAFWLYYSQGLTVSNYSNFQLELGSTATAYEPYNGQTFTIDLDGTRYGGTLDVRRGKLRVTHGYATVSDFTTYYSSTTFGGLHFISTNITANENGDGICSVLPVIRTGGWSITYPVISLHEGVTQENPLGYIRAYVESSSLADFQSTYADLAVVYPLTTPIEVDVDPEAIKTVDGINNVWADTGDIEVTYACDTKRYIQKVISQLA